MKQHIKAGFTDYSTLVFIPDSASTDGSGKTGLVAADLTVSGVRVETDNDVTVTDYTSSLSDLAALTTAHTDWGLKEVSSTLAPGLYRLDIADAIFASGAWTAVVYVMVTTSAAAASPMEFVLVGYDQHDGVRLGLTALPNAAADAPGGIVISDAGGLDADAQRADVAAILVDTGTTLDGRLPAALGANGNMKVDVRDLLGTAWLAPGTAGTPDVNVKLWNALTTVALPLVPTTAGRTLDVSAAGEAGIDWANVGSPTTTLDLSGTTVKTATDVEADTADIQARLPAALTAGGNIKADALAISGDTTAADNAEAFFDGTGYAGTNNVIPTVTTATSVTTVNGLAAGVITAASIADGAIDRATFAADTGLATVRSNTAQAGASTTITLDASASAVTDFYKNSLVVLTGGTGVGQGRYITAYNGTTKVATVSAWATNPDVTSTFAIIAADAIVGATAPTASQVADEVQTRTIAAVTTVNGLAANAVTAAALAADAGTEIGTAVWATAARELTAGTNIVLAKGAGVTGFTDIDAAGVRTAVGLASANLDMQLTAIEVKTDLIPAAPAAVGDIPTAIQNADALLNRDMSIGADSGSPTVRTVRQALRFLRNKWSLSGTTLTVTKEDDTTASWTAVVTTSAGADPISGSDPAS